MSKGYACLASKKIEEAGYRLESVRAEDIELIRQFRNQQKKVLRQKNEISEAEQKAYFAKNIFPDFENQRPSQILLSFFSADQFIGYGGLVHLDWESGRGEISFLLETSRAQNPAQYERDFSQFLRLITRVGFQALGLNKIFTETYDVRPTHIQILEKHGLRLEGRLRQHISVEGQLVDSLFHGLLKDEYEF